MWSNLMEQNIHVLHVAYFLIDSINICLNFFLTFLLKSKNNQI